MARLVVQADYNIAYLHYLRGEYTRALELYQATGAQAEPAGDAYHRALCDLDRSELYLELNLAEEAAELAAGRAALARFETPGGCATKRPRRSRTWPIAASRGATPRGRCSSSSARASCSPAKETRSGSRSSTTYHGARAAIATGDTSRRERLCQERAPRSSPARRCRQGGAVRAGALAPALGELDAGDPRGRRARAAKRAAEGEGLQSPILSYQRHFLLGQVREAQQDPARAPYAAFEKARGRPRDTCGATSRAGRPQGGVPQGQARRLREPGRDVPGRGLGRADARKRAFGYIEQAKSRSLADLHRVPREQPVAARRARIRAAR